MKTGFFDRNNFISIAVIGLAASLMILASTGDMWLDEVLSYQWAKSAKSPWEILSLFRHDNNHLLNTLWIYCVGQSKPEWAYRLLSIFSGIVSLILVACISRIILERAQWVPLVLCSFSYPLLLYFSEARGYAPAIACSLACFYILLKSRTTPLWLGTPLFWIVSVMGFLAHATFIYFLLAMSVWVVLVQWNRTKSLLVAVRSLVWSAVPLSLFGIFYFYFLKNMMIAGGPTYSAVYVISEYFSYAVGFPFSRQVAWIPLIFGGLLLLGAVFFSSFREPHLKILFLLAFAIMPILGLLVSPSPYLYFRYFIIGLPCFYFLLGGMASRLLVKWPKAERLCFFVALIFVVLQYFPTAMLITHGRASARKAIETISQGESKSVILTSNHHMMVGIVIQFYRRRMDLLNDFQYVQPDSTAGTPNWVIVSDQDRLQSSAPDHVDLGENRFLLVKSFPSSPVSGSKWSLYRLSSELSTQ